MPFAAGMTWLRLILRDNLMCDDFDWLWLRHDDAGIATTTTTTTATTAAASAVVSTRSSRSTIR